jgi:hypothetical protein
MILRVLWFQKGLRVGAGPLPCSPYTCRVWKKIIKNMQGIWGKEKRNSAKKAISFFAKASDF